MDGEPFSAAEIEFISEDEEIEIAPRFGMESLHLVTQDIGPFRAGLPIKVPMWLALSLKKSGMCNIKPPFWLDEAHLTACLEHEKEDDNFYEPLPYHYMEIASQLLSEANDDIPDHAKIRLVLLDIEEVRYAKTRRVLDLISGEDVAYKCNNLSAMEINRVRPYFAKTVDRLAALTNQVKDED